jgi:hypothetical protein
MRALVVLLPCAACNSLLGLEPTTELPIDAPPVPFVCLPLPTFRSQPMKLSDGRSDYTSDSHEVIRAVAWNQTRIQEGLPKQDQFMDSILFEPQMQASFAPRISPSGEQLFVHSPGATGVDMGFRVFARGVNEWTSPVPIAFVGTPLLDSNDVISTPSAGAAQRRVVLAHGPSPHTFFEMTESSPAWKADTPLTASNLTLDDIEDPYMSPDALAVVFVGTSHNARDIYILVRDTLREFTMDDLKLFYQPPVAVHTPFLNSDCSRLYFSASDGVYYVTP